MSKINTITTRLVRLITEKYVERGKYGVLREQTGIAETSWRSLVSGKQKATPEMIEKISRLHPENAFWLVTGGEDELHGHVDPSFVGRNKAHMAYMRALINGLEGKAPCITTQEVRESISSGYGDIRPEEIDSKWDLDSEDNRSSNSEYMERLEDLRQIEMSWTQAEKQFEVQRKETFKAIANSKK
jgi:hypothetical protein